MAQVETKKRSPLKSVISGGITGAIEAMITYPTEFTKTYMQLYKEWGQKGLVATVKQIYKTSGAIGFYRGLSVLVFFSVPKTGSRFGAYELARNSLFKEEAWGKDSRMRSLLCGLFAGCTEAIIAVTPMETVKVRLIHDRIAGTNKYNGLFNGMSVIGKAEGFWGLYKGLGPTIMKQGSNQAIRFLVYNDLFKTLKRSMNETVAMMIAGGCAGAASVYANTPVDVVKTIMQGERSSEFKGPIDCAKDIWKNEGVRGFYKGTVPRLSRVVIDVALTFALYEHITRSINYAWPDK